MEKIQEKQTKKRFTWSNEHPKLSITLVIVLALFAITLTSGNDNGPDTRLDKTVNFSMQAKERFAQIESNIPELSIECYQSINCNVAYFNFTGIPNNPEYGVSSIKDMKDIVRSSAASLSSFKNNTVGVSQVSIIMTLEGKEIFVCDANGGKITECK